MNYRTIPKNNDKLSLLGFGCMRFPTKGGLIDEKAATRILHLAIDSGVNYLDTAYPYHAFRSESFLGKALQDGYREKVKIATKLPIYLVKNRSDMDKILDKQLEKLRVESIDYYLLHMLTGYNHWTSLKEMGVIKFLEDAKRAGKIKNIGFSYHGDLEGFKKIIDDYDWIITQIQYNYLDTNTQAGTEGLIYAYERDIAVIIMEPLRGGSLARKLPDKAIRALKKANPSWSPASFALRWIADDERVTSILSGMTTEHDVLENLKTLSEAAPGSMTEKEKTAVGEAKQIFEEREKVPCTGCGYCMPCPFGVDIRSAFQLYNEKYIFESSKPRWFYLNMHGGLAGGSKSTASLCTECGKCMKACPQEIDIISELKNVRKDFEGIIYPVADKVVGLYRKIGKKQKM